MTTLPSIVHLTKSFGLSPNLEKLGALARRRLLLFMSCTVYACGMIAQDVDQDGQNLNVAIECSNLDLSQFEADLENILNNFPWTDNNTGGCNGNLDYVPGSISFNSASPFTCNTGELDIEIEIDCDGSVQTINVSLDVEDFEQPFDHISYNSLVNPTSLGNVCNGTQGDADLQNWIDMIEANDFNGGAVFGDNCTSDPTSFVITTLNNPLPLDYNNGDGCALFDIDFEVTDECGNLETFTYQYEVVDNEAPVISISSTSSEIDACDTGSIRTELENLLLQGTTDSCSAPTSLSDFEIMPDVTDPSTWTYVMRGCSGYVEFEVAYADPCSNISGSVPVQIDVFENTPPTVIDVDSTGPQPDCFVINGDCSASSSVPVVTAQYPCTMTTVIYDRPLVNVFNDCVINDEYIYDDTDACGNFFNYKLEEDVGPEKPLTDLDLAMDNCMVEIVSPSSECDEMETTYCFPTNEWQDNLTNPNCSFDPFPILDSTFDGGCPPYHITVDPPYAPMPTFIDRGGGDTLFLGCPPVPFSGTITWTVTDYCGELLIWSFDIDLICTDIPVVDNDGDGWNSDVDCDDQNPDINPGATELPGNGIDEDCDGEDGPTATLELDGGVQIEVHPNPVTDVLQVYHGSERTMSYQLSNLGDQTVKKGRLMDSTIEVGSLPSGLYILSIYHAGAEQESAHTWIMKL